MKLIITLIFALAVAGLCLVSTRSSAQTTLEGNVFDKESKENIPFATIQITKNGVFIQGVNTDLEGKYKVNLDPGTYDLEVSFVGYTTQTLYGVQVLAGKINKVDIPLSPEGAVLEEIEVVEYSVPLVAKDNTTQGHTITAQDIKNMPRKERQTYKKLRKGKSRKSKSKQAPPSRNVHALSATTAGVSSADKGSSPTVRGSRSNTTNHYVEGKKVTGEKAPPPPPPPLVTQEVPQEKIHQESSYQETKQSIDEADKKPEPETGEEYQSIVENKFISPKEEAFSTFSIDVDHAAYSNIRRFVLQNQQPPRDAVRIEEMINYFNYDYPLPESQHPFTITTEIADCPWAPGHQLLHIGLQGEYIPFEQSPANNLVFLIDVSGSMRNANKLELLKRSFKLLVDKLRPQDKVAIVVYAGAAGMVLPPTSGADKSTIHRAIDGLVAGGSTAGGDGINLAYKIAKQAFVASGNNRVILATDGDFNVGVSDNKSLEKLIEEKRKDGIFLTVLGFGMGNLKDAKLEILADKGNGNYAYIDNDREARKVFVDELTSNLYTIAKDVKIQLQFNPNFVKEYRLIGYENRLLAKEDFDDDTKDAGELGSGHSVTALYEIIPASKTVSPIEPVAAIAPVQIEPVTDPIQNPIKKGITDDVENVMLIKFRYKPPKENKSKLIRHYAPIDQVKKLKESSENFRFSAAVAGFGMLLRDSNYKGNIDLKMVIELAKNALGEDKFGYRTEFLALVERAQKFNFLTGN